MSPCSVYNDAGADDGSAQGFSWEMVSTANAEFPHMALRSPEIVKWNDTVTGTLTATVEIVHNSQGSGTSGALLDSEIWLEVMYLSTSGVPLGSWVTDRCANLDLNSDAADQASSSATWTGDAAGWDTQKLVRELRPEGEGLCARTRNAGESIGHGLRRSAPDYRLTWQHSARSPAARLSTRSALHKGKRLVARSSMRL